MAGKYDFDAIKRQYPLIDAVRRRVKGVTNEGGGEFKCLCPFHGEKTPSFTIYTGRAGYQRWKCYGCGEDGDIIDFVSAYDGLSTQDAIAAITNNAPPLQERAPLAPVEEIGRYDGYTFAMPPEDAGTFAADERTPPVLNVKKNKTVQYRPSMVFPYRNADGKLIGYVIRLEFRDGDPIVMGVWWMQRPDKSRGWTVAPMQEPRPPYGLHDISSRPKAPVIIPEGEKCREAAARLMPKAVAASWQGGCGAYAKTDWRPIANRQVLLWTDNDPEGERAMLGSWSKGEWRPGLAEILIGHGCTIHYIGRDPQRPKGWDVADAEAEGWTEADMRKHAKARARPLTLDDLHERRDQIREAEITRQEAKRDDGAPKPQARTTDQVKPKPDKTETAAEPPPREADGNVVSLHGAPLPSGIDDSNWHSELKFTDEGRLKATSALNTQLIITFDVRYRELFAWDDFAQRVVVNAAPPWRKTRPGPYPRAAADDDVISLRGDLERRGLSVKKNDVGAAMLVAAKYRPMNPVRDYLDALAWDQEPRLFGGLSSGGDALPCWLAQYAGARHCEINAAFGARWMISAVARVFRPGCKVDTMLILEGKQGKKKSSALEALAEIGTVKYHTDSVTDTHSKDAVQQMQGKWIVEFAELDALNKADANAFKGFMTRRIDTIRVPYAAAPDDFPRACVFAGTVNPDGTGYLKDPTGARRFWPVRTGDVDLDQLRADRDQLWAEAVHRFKAGEQWWLTDAEEELARQAQKARYQADPWGYIIDTYIAGATGAISIPFILRDALSIPAHLQNVTAERRVAAHLVSKGYVRKIEAVELGRVGYIWTKPEPEDDA